MNPASSGGARPETATAGGFRRELGLWDTTVIVAGAIIGVGIFVNPSNVARILPAPEWMLLVWLAGGALAMIGGFVYAELGSRLPVVGGQYVYLARSWGPFAGFLYGFALLFVINTGGMAAVASALAGYVDSSFWHLGSAAKLALAAGVIVVLTEINVRGVRPGKRTNNGLMALKLGGIAAIALLVLVKRPPSATTYHLPTTASVTLTAFFAALVPVLFAYGGWQNCGSLAAEIRDAGKTLAKANILGVALVVTVYVGLNWIYLWVLSPADIAGSTALAADVARALAGDLGARFVSALTVVSCLGFLAVITMTGPRLYYAMARDGLFLRRAATLHPRFGTPSFTLRLQAAVALVLLFSQTYDQLLSYVVFCDWLFFGLTAAGLFQLRRQATGSGLSGDAPFRAPGHPWTTAIFVALSCGVVVNSFIAAPKQALAGCAVLAVGAAGYFLSQRRTPTRA
ncbi:MAG: amino acid permease [Thermoanaerobaculia bacterium]